MLRVEQKIKTMGAQKVAKHGEPHTTGAVI